MAEQSEQKKKVAKRKPRPRPTSAVQFTVWADNGQPLTDAVVAKFEEAIQAAQFELFNDGFRVLTQTNKA